MNEIYYLVSMIILCILYSYVTHKYIEKKVLAKGDLRLVIDGLNYHYKTIKEL